MAATDPATPPSADATTSPPRVRRSVRWAWLIAGSVVAAVTLGWATTQAVVALAHETETLVDTIDADGVATLVVDNSAGEVRVVGTEADGVTVTAEVSDGLRATEHRVAVVGDQLRVEGSCPLVLSDFCDVAFTIEAPRSLAVDLDASAVEVAGMDGGVDARSNHGDLEVRDVTGDLSLVSDRGDITATEVRAEEVNAAADQGDVRVELVTASQRVSATSELGDVEVVLPDGPARYRLVTDTDFGEVTTPVRTDPGVGRSITATTAFGDVVVRYG